MLTRLERILAWATALITGLFLAITLTIVYLLPVRLDELSHTARLGLAWHLMLCIGTHMSYSTARAISRPEARQDSNATVPPRGWSRWLAGGFPPHSWPGLAMAASLLLYHYGTAPTLQDIAGWILVAGLAGAVLTAGRHVWRLQRR